MIGRIRGTLLEKRAPEILVECSGLGYEVLVPMTTLYQLPDPGSEVTLLTHFVVREDAQQLYGFIDGQTRSLFRDLIKVNGVGPKLALTVLSGVDVGEFVALVLAEDSASLVKLPGVGKKTAERLVIEMRDRLKDYQPAGAGVAPAARKVDAGGEAEEALIALGYKPQEASRAIAAVSGDDLPVEELIRQALKTMISK
ncbi:MAG TPA: Holliday junction branch migration protein RuvA [Spongiibacteraceae bacterium]|nr:Holliday junction branch migration protein RuvA [Spongiibacteraceae bacterium]HCS26412.1 Holliday junction branch migration protein RuvA [Spongiibacteraceae bacterium]|tara:strand:- start:212 stop:805 length:594 start_codon:yes stop_codon:yes gene_type:complete